MEEILFTPMKLTELGNLIESSVRKALNEGVSINHESHKVDSDLINIKQASELLGLAVPTIYAKVSERLIPHSKQGKKLFFSREQLAAWIKSGQRKTVADLQTEAENFIKSKSKKS